MSATDAIVTAFLIVWLYVLVHMFVKLMHGFRTHVYYCSDELYYATRIMIRWIEEGKIKSHHHLEITSHLIKLIGRDADTGFNRLRLIAGPNGWTVYQTLLAKRNLWKRLFIRTWNR